MRRLALRCLQKHVVQLQQVARYRGNMAVLHAEHQSSRCLRSYFDTYGHSRRQMEGFEKFCDVILPSIIHENSTMTFYGKLKRHTVSFGHVYVIKPTVHDLASEPRPLYPFEARVRSLTYSVRVLVNVRHTQRYLTKKSRTQAL